jgi:hypothetical protein
VRLAAWDPETGRGAETDTLWLGKGRGRGATDASTAGVRRNKRSRGTRAGAITKYGVRLGGGDVASGFGWWTE